MRINIVGLGPAGAIVGLRAAARGWEVHGYDPAGLRVWPATYGLIDHDIPAWFKPFLSSVTSLTVIADAQLSPTFGYRMLNSSSLVQAVAPLMTVHQESVEPEVLAAHDPDAVVVDCRGAHAAEALWQVAVGIVVPDHVFKRSGAAPTLPVPVFMDWSALESHYQPPASFLYVQRVDEGWLFEETILATKQDCRNEQVREQLRTSLEAMLRERLKQRGLAGITDEIPERELVFIPMGTRLPESKHPRVASFGARAGMINPATGYSVGAAAMAVETLLDSCAEFGKAEPLGWAKMRKTLSRVNAHVAHLLRNIGGELIATANQDTLRDFFRCFFNVKSQHQLAYLVGDDGIGVARTMWALRKQTKFRHQFLMPLWRNPWRIIAPAWHRTF